MRPGIRSPLRILIFSALVVSLGLLGLTASSAIAQTTTCVDQPALGFFDGNGDGVLSIAEIQSAAPGNTELQAVASDLEAAGISGIQYTGCDGTGGGDQGGGSGEGSGGSDQGSDSSTGSGDDTQDHQSGEGSGDSTAAGSLENATTPGNAEAEDETNGTDAVPATDSNVESANVTDDVDETVVTALPGVGHGASSDADVSVVMHLLSVTSIGAVVVALLMRQRSMA